MLWEPLRKRFHCQTYHLNADVPKQKKISSENVEQYVTVGTSIQTLSYPDNSFDSCYQRSNALTRFLTSVAALR